MTKTEKIPLLESSLHRETGTRRSDGYLLLSVPPSEEKTFINKLSNFGNHASMIVATSVVVIVVIIIVIITYHANVTEINNGPRNVMEKRSISATPDETVNDNGSQVITMPLGKLKGYIRKSRLGRDFLSFLKVPYAKPPIENLRFKDPQPADAWEGVRDETEGAPQCIQKARSTDEAMGVEDCLYSNIYIPVGTQEVSNYPVMVYIHGGGFGVGNGSQYGAEYFMDENVILITFEYRLGLLGFLNTGDREVTGNMGFKDQVMLLKWVRMYISYFGGDPSRVTIFGNSIGGIAVSVLTISPMGKDLFHRAISESGTALCETVTTTIDLKPEMTKEAVAKRFNCSTETTKELLNCLRTQNAKALVLFKPPAGSKYALTIDKGFDPKDLSDVFMPEQPYRLLQSGKVNPVPYMIGVMSTEMIVSALVLLKDVNVANRINANFSGFVPEFLKLDLTAEESQLVKDFYFGVNDVGNLTERNLTNAISDCIFVHCSKVAADMHSKYADTYLYYISKHPKQSYADKYLVNFPFIDKNGVVSHADEVHYLLPYSRMPEYPTTDTEYFPFSQFLVKLWAHFAATGNPVMNPDMADWKTVNISQKQGAWFELNDNLGVTTVLDERMAFLDRFSHKQLRYEL